MSLQLYIILKMSIEMNEYPDKWYPEFTLPRHDKGKGDHKKVKNMKLQNIQIFPEMQVNEMHAPYDKHHKVSSFLKSHQNSHNSVKYEVIWKWHFVVLKSL